MKWLAFDCSTDIASIAIGEQNKVASKQIEGVRRHSQMIISSIQALLHSQKWRPAQLDAIILGRGPGSFTGLRVACSVAQGIALAHNLPVYPVSCLQSIAHALRLQGEKRPVMAAVDARMNELYWSYYGNDCQHCQPERVSDITEMNVEQDNTVLAGVGLHPYLMRMNETMKQKIIEVKDSYPNLDAMVDLVNKKMIEPVQAAQALPVYIRNQVTQGASNG